VVGLGLRNLAQCPVELNLVPKSILKRQQLDQKKPYFIAAIFSLVAVVFAYGWFYDRLAAVKAAAYSEIMIEVDPLQAKADQLQQYEGRIDAVKSELEAFTGWVGQRFFWPDLLAELRKILMTTEKNLASPGQDVGVWLETFGNIAQTTPTAGTETATSESENSGTSFYMMDPVLMKRYGLTPRGPAAPAAEETSASGTAGTGATNQVDSITATFRAINLNRANQRSANGNLAFAVEEALKASEWFEKDGTKLSNVDQVEESAPTFTFGMTLKLKKPIKD
jgi:hypothetical protein